MLVEAEGCTKFDLKYETGHLLLPMDDFGNGRPGHEPRSMRKMMREYTTRQDDRQPATKNAPQKVGS